MCTFRLCVVICLMVGFLASTTIGEVTIETVTVGNPGNANDEYGFGSVSYNYEIGKYEITAGQYCEFLNAVAKNDVYRLWNSGMAKEEGCQITQHEVEGICT